MTESKLIDWGRVWDRYLSWRRIMDDEGADLNQVNISNKIEELVEAEIAEHCKPGKIMDLPPLPTPVDRRTYLAGQALAGYRANPQFATAPGNVVATYCRDDADELIKELGSDAVIKKLEETGR